MLDRTKLIKNFSSVADRLFPNSDAQSLWCQKIWEELVADASFPAFVGSLPSKSITPLWRGDLAQVIPVDRKLKEYSILGVDGSQIYPDRHIEGAGCFLINSGGCWISYGSPSKAELFSEPQIFLLQQQVIPGMAIAVTEDMVDLVREQHELLGAIAKTENYRLASSQNPYLCLFDGGLIFWYLENKQEAVQKYFLDQYIRSLSWFAEEKVLVAGYISFPKSCELANLIRVRVCLSRDKNATPCYGKIANCPCLLREDIIDKAILSWFLPPYCRTTVFSNRSSIVDFYPAELAPHFFYLNTGIEIVRIEIPAWILAKQGALDLIATICLDQTGKGGGYPVVLAEAHEQAVVRANDREFFFDLIRKSGLDRNKHLVYSQKSIKKRTMSI